MTPAVIESETFRFVAQHINNCATAVPTKHVEIDKYTKNKHTKNKLFTKLALFTRPLKRLHIILNYTSNA